MKKTYRVEYWYHASDSFDVKANSKEEAEEIIRNRIESGEIDVSQFEMGDDGYEVYEA